MFIKPSGSLPINDESSRNDYRANVETILRNIKSKFIEAVQKVNSDAVDSPYKIFFRYYDDHGKAFGAGFEECLTCAVWINSGTEMNYTLITSPDTSREFFLGNIVPYSDFETLQRMAKTGNVSDFEEVYANWVDELSKELKFFEENHNEIRTAKEKINEVFKRAISDASGLISSQNSAKLIVGTVLSFNSSEKYEPLDNCPFWVMDGPIQKLVGSVKIIESRERFKQILNDGCNEADLTEIFERCSKNMKDRYDAMNAPFTRSIGGPIGKAMDLALNWLSRR